jgi:hypothetical protein
VDDVDVAVARAAARARTEALTGRPDGLVVAAIEWVPPGTPTGRHSSGFYDRSPWQRSLPYLVALSPAAAITLVLWLVAR